MSEESDINTGRKTSSGTRGTDDPPRLIRPESSRLWLGVAEGLGRYFRVEPVFIRIAFLAGVFFSGLGLIAYLALALFVPSGDDPDAPDLRAPYQTNPWLGAIGGSLLVLALVPALHGGFWHWGPFGGGWMFLAIGIGIAIYLFVRDRDRGTGPVVGAPMAANEAEAEETQAPPTVDSPIAAGFVAPDEPDTADHPEPTTAALTAEAPATASTAEVPVAGAPKRSGAARAAAVGGIIAASIISFCGATLLAVFGMAAEASIVLVAAGLVLVVGGLVGRMRWLAIPVLAGALGLCLAVATDFQLEGELGEFRQTPQTQQDIPAEGFQLAAGKLVVDLRQFEWEEDQALPLRVEAGAGQVAVLVDEDVCVESRIRVGAGQIISAGEMSDGISIERIAATGGDVTPRLVLDGQIALGEFAVFAGDGFAEDMEISTGDIDLANQARISEAACQDRG